MRLGISFLLYTASALHLNTAEQQPPVFFFLHRKAGEFLTTHFLDLLKGKYGFDNNWRNVEWHTIEPGKFSHCQGSNLIFYQDMNPGTLDQIGHDCPTFRAIHLKRDQIQTVMSNYVYTKNLTLQADYMEKKFTTNNMQEPLDAIMFGNYLRQVTFETGVLDTCEVQVRLFGPSAVSTSQKIKDEKLENILELRFEDFQEDFNASSRAIFEHIFFQPNISKEELLQKNIKVEELVAAASQYDIANADANDPLTEGHITDVEEKEKVEAQLKKLSQEKNTCVEELKRQNRQLAYKNRELK